MNGDNRDFRVVEAIASSPGVSWFDVKSGVIGQAFDSLVPASISAVLAFIGAMATGQWIVPEPETARIAIAGIAAWLSFNGLYLIDRRLAAPRYRAEYGGEVEEDENEPALLRTGAEHVQHRRLNPEMRKLMKKMAARYPSVNTLAVNRWERGQPFTRSEIQDLRAYLILIGAADRKERGGIELNDFGKSKLSEWAVGIFDGTALPQSGASSPVLD